MATIQMISILVLKAAPENLLALRMLEISNVQMKEVVFNIGSGLEIFSASNNLKRVRHQNPWSRHPELQRKQPSF